MFIVLVYYVNPVTIATVIKIHEKKSQLKKTKQNKTPNPKPNLWKCYRAKVKYRSKA